MTKRQIITISLLAGFAVFSMIFIAVVHIVGVTQTPTPNEPYEPRTSGSKQEMINSLPEIDDEVISRDETQKVKESNATEEGVTHSQDGVTHSNSAVSNPPARAAISEDGTTNYYPTEYCDTACFEGNAFDQLMKDHNEFTVCLELQQARGGCFITGDRNFSMGEKTTPLTIGSKVFVDSGVLVGDYTVIDINEFNKKFPIQHVGIVEGVALVLEINNGEAYRIITLK